MRILKPGSAFELTAIEIKMGRSASFLLIFKSSDKENFSVCDEESYGPAKFSQAERIAQQVTTANQQTNPMAFIPKAWTIRLLAFA